MPYDEGDRTWKVQVIDKQGLPSGLLKLARVEEEQNGEEFLRWNDKRHWTGKPRDQHFETLLQWESTDGTAFFLLIHFGHDLTERDYARKLTPQDAVDWLSREGYDLPDDLHDLDSASKTGTASSSQCQPLLTPALQEVWDLLARTILTAKELAAKVAAAPVSEDSIRKRIAAIRRFGRVVKNRRGLGYYRSDAPPAIEREPDGSPVELTTRGRTSNGP